MNPVLHALQTLPAVALCHTWTLFVVGVTHLVPRVRNAGRAQTTPRRGGIALIGPFKTLNWARAHVLPLTSALEGVAVTVFCDSRVPDLPPAHTVRASRLVATLFGESIGRTLAFIRWSFRHRPELVIGYHLPWNGLVALAVGRLIGARVAYFSIGGVEEFRGGGVYSEHLLFTSMGRPSERLEARMLGLIGQFDYLLTMGKVTAHSLQQFGLTQACEPISVAIDTARFSAAARPEAYIDVICAARLVPIKQPELLVQAIARARELGLPNIRAVIAGAGPLQARLEVLCGSLGIAENVRFIGWDDNIEYWYQCSRLFVLTSRSEGLPIAMLEAMACGVPAIAPRVGDVEDILPTGHWVQPINGSEVEGCAQLMVRMLTLDAASYERKRREAIELAQQYGLAPRSGQWRKVLRRWGLRQDDDAVS